MLLVSPRLPMRLELVTLVAAFPFLAPTMSHVLNHSFFFLKKKGLYFMGSKKVLFTVSYFYMSFYIL